MSALFFVSFKIFSLKVSVLKQILEIKYHRKRVEIYKIFDFQLNKVIFRNWLFCT